MAVLITFNVIMDSGVEFWFLCFIHIFIQSADSARVPTSPIPEPPKRCHNPLSIRHGRHNIWGEGTLIEFFCNEGFFAIGPTFGSCNPLTRRWSIRPPKCVATGCPEPLKPDHGNFYLEFNATKVTVLCEKGYNIYGSRVRYCDGSNWRGIRPRCRNKHEASGDRQQQSAMTSTLSPAVIAAEQLKQAVLDGDNTCYLSYTAPPELEHATFRVSYEYNKVSRVWVLIANYSCEEGYVMQDKYQNYRYCKNYRWHAAVAPLCVTEQVRTSIPDPCKTNNGGCQHICHSFGSGMYKCLCLDGFALDRFGRRCEDIDECKLYNGDCEQDCHNTPGSFFCTCREGYITTGNICIDEDECAVSGANLCPGDCINIPGSYICNCSIAGYQSSNHSNFCEDMDECSMDNGGCDGKCLNTPGSYKCRCGQKGYRLSKDRHTCIDVDECVRYKKKICRHGNCSNTIGSYTCTCDMGYIPDKTMRKCIDINECKTDNGGCSDSCMNIPGGFICRCDNPGYILASDGFSCLDKDECSLMNGNCEDVCINTDGSYHCLCSDAMKVLADDNRTCTYCHDEQYMNLTSGACEYCPQNSYTNPETGTSPSDCQCYPGYQVNDNSTGLCTDIDECSNGQLWCEFACQNVVGSAYCYCPEGYNITDHNTCIDIDECNDTAVNKCNQTCINLPGSYNCTCDEGFILGADGFTCDDVDECYQGNKNCSHICVNTHGGAICQCPPGYDLQDNITCTDIDECAAHIDVCEDVCINVEGSYHCDCSDHGFKLSWDLASCVDINECMEGENLCEDNCQNTLGSYNCVCSRPGYQVNPEDVNTCIDIDECASAETNICKQLCINRPGQFRCDCHPGYALYSFTSCARCPRNFYRSADIPECVRCPRFSVTTNSGSTSIAACKCHAGYHGNLTAGEPCLRKPT